MLARLLGLPVPNYFIAHVVEQAARAAPELFRSRILANVGQNFATDYMMDTYPWVAHADERRDGIVNILEDVLAFDAALLNGDRTARKTNLVYDGERLWLIDHSLAMPVLDGCALLTANHPYPRETILAHCAYTTLQGKGRLFSGLFERWRERVDRTTLADIRRAIPPSWETRSGELDSIFAFLGKRPERFDEIRQTLTEVVR